jgi:predicted O-methyltransferase YrrM
MYSSFGLLTRYLRYYSSAANGNGHGIHSPFVFDFIKTVLNDRKQYSPYPEIERERVAFRNDPRVLEVADYGAGSAHTTKNQRKISDIARHALKPKKYAALLFRMVQKYRPSVILELGTSLGITTAYLAKAAPAARVYTLEGSPAIAEQASALFKRLKLHNVVQVTGNFDSTLGSTLKDCKKPDFVFLDGNHRYAPTVAYFETLLPVLHEYSVVVFDDIHWSAGMEQAWDECKSNPAVTLSIDLFFVGVLFFRSDFKIPQHFTIRF